MQFVDFGSALSDVVVHFGYGAVFFLILLESAGVPLPGETALVTASALAATTEGLDISPDHNGRCCWCDPWRQSRLLDRPSIRSRFPPPLWPLRPPFRRSYNDLSVVVSPIRRPCRFLWPLYRVFAHLCSAPRGGSQLSSRRVFPLECERRNCLGRGFWVRWPHVRPRH